MWHTRQRTRRRFLVDGHFVLCLEPADVVAVRFDVALHAAERHRVTDRRPIELTDYSPENGWWRIPKGDTRGKIMHKQETEA